MPGRTIFHPGLTGKFWTAFFEDHLNNCGLCIAIFGLEAAGDELHLLNAECVDIVFPGIVRLIKNSTKNTGKTDKQ